MKSPLIASFLLLSLLFAGCYSARESTKSAPDAQLARVSEGQIPKEAELKQVSLAHADQVQASSDAVDRKILKDAEITLEVNSPLEAQRKVSSIAGAHGGFVVTSESKERESNDPNRHDLDIKLVMRVPAAQFEAVLDEIRANANRILQNKQTGQDVTEEFIDLEARVKTQKALEAQFLEIMKQAGKVTDALEVQRQIAEVRTEIERLEGRKRFLENRASLSTITVNIQPPGRIISTSGFGQTVKDAVSESLAIASAIVLFLVQFAIIMIPIFVLIILPGGLVLRYFYRRSKRLQLARQLEPVSQ